MRQSASVGLLVVALFGIGPAAAQMLHFRLAWLDRLCPEPAIAHVERVGYAVAALLFFALFCLATYTTSETRILGEEAPYLDLPLWLLQSLLIVAFGNHVLRFSLYSADPALRPGNRNRAILPPFREI